MRQRDVHGRLRAGARAQIERNRPGGPLPPAKGGAIMKITHWAAALAVGVVGWQAWQWWQMYAKRPKP